MLLALDFNIFNSISKIVDYISSLISNLISIFNVIIGLFSTFFSSMPKFISTGFMLAFGLSMIIMLIKIVR